MTPQSNVFRSADAEQLRCEVSRLSKCVGAPLVLMALPAPDSRLAIEGDLLRLDSEKLEAIAAQAKGPLPDLATLLASIE